MPHKRILLILLCLFALPIFSAVGLGSVDLETGLNYSGTLRAYRYLTTTLPLNRSSYLHLGYEVETNPLSWVGSFHEYRLYLHHYADYPWLPFAKSLRWGLGASYAGSVYVPGAISFDLILRTREPLQIAWLKFYWQEEFSFYRDVVQLRFQLELLPINKIIGFPINVTPVLYSQSFWLASNVENYYKIGLRLQWSE